MKKKYKCRLSACSLLVNVKGKVLRLEFEPDVVNIYGLRGCSYSTDKEDIQRAIEHNRRFLSGLKDAIWTDDIEPAKPVVKEEVKPVVEPVVEAAPVVEPVVEAPVAEEPAPVAEEVIVEEAPVEEAPKPKRARRAKKVEEE